jgi:hypothetical protein
MNDSLIVVVRRTIPVDGQTDIVTGIFDADTSLRDACEWSMKVSAGCAIISLEICADANRKDVQ